MTQVQRKTTLFVALATISAAFVGFVAAGNAFASEWTEYEGRVAPGQAYLVTVDEGAEALQVALEPGLLGASAAQFTLFGPDDRRIGHYALTRDEASVALDGLEAGDHVLYVFGVQNGALTVAKKGGADDLALVPLETETANHEVAVQDSIGAFRALGTVSLDREPVFEALLYKGSAVNLSGTVRSPLGETSVVRMETGTAHGPGLFTQQSGARESFAANYAAGMHSIDAVADEFEGTLFLTTVHYLRPGEVVEDVETLALPSNAIVFDDSWEAKAVAVPEGAASLDFGLVSATRADEDEEHDEEDGPGFPTPGGGGRGGWHHDRAVLAVYAPDDQLLGFVELTDESPTQSLALVGGGEYVVFAWSAGDDGAFAVLDGGAVAFGPMRHLRTHEEATTLAAVASPVMYEESFVIEMAKAPLAVGIGMKGESAYALDLATEIHTSAGRIEAHDWSFPGQQAMPFFRWSHAHYAGEELVAGTWALDARALSGQGDLTLFTLVYDRELVEDEDEEHVEDEP